MMLPLCIRMICLDTLRADARAVRLGRKERNENIGRHIGRYAAAVVGHVDGHLLGLGTIGGTTISPSGFPATA